MNLKKKIKVSDPDGQEEITVEMWHDNIFEDDTVRIMFDSIDDFQIIRSKLVNWLLLQAKAIESKKWLNLIKMVM